MERPDLIADCSACFGLCCVALAFERSVDFPVDKDAGEPCVNLDDGFGCGIHPRLRDEGYRGCTVYDCLGAGQKVSQVTFGGVSWRDAPATSADMFAALPVMRQLHEMIAFLDEARVRTADGPLHVDLTTSLAETEALTLLPPDDLLAVDLGAHRSGLNALLVAASGVAREAHEPVDHRGADLVGARLAGADLRGADLRAALLIAGDLRGADLRDADLIGSDLRDADLAGADLRGAMFVTQMQLNAARGDQQTRLPGTLVRPVHWTA